MDAVSRFVREGVEEEIRLLIYDLGGQRVFYTLHHLFLTRYAVYFVVFDMRRLVDMGATELIDESEPSKGSRPVYDVAGCVRFLRFWLCSLFTHARGAKVLLVGTHGDSMSSAEQHRAVAEQLEEAFSIDNAANGAGMLLGMSPAGLSVEWNEEDNLCFFPVDNSCRPADPILKRLKRKVDTILQEEEFVQEPVPLEWYDLHDQLQARATDKAEPTHVLRRAEVAALAPSLSEVKLEAALQLFHKLGMVLYFSDEKLREWVMLDPQFVVDRIGAVVRDYALHPMPSDRRARMLGADWVRLARKGIASEKLLHCLWHEHEAMIPHLTQLLEKLQLACPLPGEPTRYLVPSVLPAVDAAEASGFADAHDCADAHKCWLCLELGGTSDGGIPFLPESLWARLLVKCEQYSMVLNRRGGGAESLNELTRDWALLVFSGQPFLLRRDEASHEVSMLIRDAYPTAVAEQVAQLASDVCAEWMSELRVRLFVAVEGERFELREAECSLRERRPIHHSRTKRELTRADFAPWVPPDTESSYDVFIGYRQESESTLAQLLYHDLGARTIGQDGRQLRVFLDRERLQMGKRYDLGFAEGLAASSVVVPLISHGAIEGMEDLDPDNGKDWVDYLLVEWQLALALTEAGRVQAIQPILIGKLQPDGAMSNFFTDGSKGRLKDSVSAATLAAVRDYAQHIGLELSKKAASRTIKQTLEDMLCFQTTLWWDLKGGHGMARTDLESDTPFARMCAELVLGCVLSETAGCAMAASASAPQAAVASTPQGAAAPFSVASDAYAGLLREQLERQGRQIDTLQGVLAHNVCAGVQAIKQDVSKVQADVSKVLLTQQEALTILKAHSTMLTTLLRASAAIAPRYVVFMPAAAVVGAPSAASRLEWLASPKQWLSQRVHVFFVDPIRLRLAPTNEDAQGVARGFALDYPQKWVAKAMPYMQLGLTTLRVAGLAGRLITGFPVPDVGAWLGSQLAALGELKVSAISEVGSLTADPALAEKLLTDVDNYCQGVLQGKLDEAKAVADSAKLGERLEEPLAKSLKELDKLLGTKHPDWQQKCGLEQAFCAADGSSEWVLQADKAEYERTGRAMLDAGPVAGGGGAAAAPTEESGKALLDGCSISLEVLDGAVRGAAHGGGSSAGSEDGGGAGCGDEPDALVGGVSGSRAKPTKKKRCGLM